MTEELKSVLVHPTMMRYHEVTRKDIEKAVTDAGENGLYGDIINNVWAVLTK